MIGAVVGDIVGSMYEFNNYCAKDFSPFFHPRSHITDDTVCTVAVADILLNHKEPASTLKAWCQAFWSVGGWGQRFGQWVQSDSMLPYRSFGNGAAMRVSPVIWVAESEDEVFVLSDRVTAITHNHPEGLKGARAAALAGWLGRKGVAPEDIRRRIQGDFDYDLSLSVDDIRATYAYTESCQGTVPQAITCALEGRSFEDVIRNAISIGGDSDTIAAIAGGIAEAMFGVPETIRRQALAMLPVQMKEVLLLL